MDKCPNCDGTGLTGGNPERPWEHVGALKTCSECGGSGAKGTAAPAPEPTPEEDPKAEGGDGSVDASMPSEPSGEQQG